MGTGMKRIAMAMGAVIHSFSHLTSAAVNAKEAFDGIRDVRISPRFLMGGNNYGISYGRRTASGRTRVRTKNKLHVSRLAKRKNRR